MRRQKRLPVIVTIAALAALGMQLLPGSTAGAAPASLSPLVTTTAPPSTTPSTTAATTTTVVRNTQTTPSRTTGGTPTTTVAATTPTAPTSTVADCTPVPATVTGTRLGSSRIDVFYSSPSGYQCGVLRWTTFRLYTDAAHTQGVLQETLPAGTAGGAVSLTELDPSTDYYLTVTVEGTNVPPTEVGPLRTSSGITPTSTTTTTTTYICDYGGPATVAPVTSTTTTITYSYRFGGANACGRVGISTLAVTLFTDAAMTQAVQSWSAPSGATLGAREVTGLSPGTTYYARGRTTGPLGTTVYVDAFTTRSTTTAPRTTTVTTVCDPFPAQATFDSATTTSLTFGFSSGGATGCDGNGKGVTTISVYADQAHTQLVGSASSAPGSRGGLLTVTGLRPDTTYYPSVQLSNSFFSSPAMPPASTLPLTTTTCQPVGLSNPWDVTTTTITWLLPAQLCVSTLTATAYRSLEEAQGQVNPVATATVTVPTSTITLRGLLANTDYWVRFSGGYGLQGPIHTRTGPTQGTTTTTTTIPCDAAPSSATFLGATSTSLEFTFQAPGARQCGLNGVTTISVFRDAAHTSLAGSASSSPGATSGTLRIDNLAPGTTYYPVVRSTSPFGSPAMPPVQTLPGQTTTTTTTTTTVTTVCDPIPATATFLTATISSLDFSFSSPGAAVCGGGGVTTISVYRDAARTSLAGSASSAAGATSGTLRVQGLAPGTTYYPVVRLSNSPFGSPSIPAVATLPFGTVTSTTTSRTTTTTAPSTCTATWRTISAWPGGFLGEVTVRNTSAASSSSWQVGWTWSGTARLTASYHATLGGTALSPTLTALDWNRVVPPGGTTSVQVQGTVNGPIEAPSIGCTLR